MGRAGSRGGAVAAAVTAAAVAALAWDAAQATPGRSFQELKFHATLSGTISSAASFYPDGAARCRPTSEVGVWRLLTFRSARPTVITLLARGGTAARVRFLRADIRGLRGEVHLAAPSQYELLCLDGSRTTVRSDYFTGSSSWRGGAVSLASPRKGTLIVGPLLGVPADPSGACGESAGAPLALELAPGRLVEAKLLNRGVARLVIRGSRRRTAQPSPACGVSEAVNWELVLRRIR